MLCSICKKNEAKVHYTKIVGDQMPKVDLCETCAKEKGVSDPGAFDDLLLGVGVGPELEQLAAGEIIRCPHCGYTQAEFKKSARLGCAECYTTFAAGMESMLKAMHKDIRHVGKLERRVSGRPSPAALVASAPVDEPDSDASLRDLAGNAARRQT